MGGICMQKRDDDYERSILADKKINSSINKKTKKKQERNTIKQELYLREKVNFDSEQIPERVLYANGIGAYGQFELYESLEEYTKASFLTNPSNITPVFVRFSSMQSSRGTNDTQRDVKGFATKFYTEEGNFDLVGNNVPIFYIHNTRKFHELVRAVKPDLNQEFVNGTNPHDQFWTFAAKNPETAHMVMWQMSDRTIPRSYRMMEGFGVHTFRLVNRKGKTHFVKFHWKPSLGVHSLVWDEAQKIGGKNPNFLSQDLLEAIKKGDYPEWELGLQLISEEDQFSYDFDILDPTKIWPEEDVPVKIIGKMTLNRNVDNGFLETEHVAFHPGHLVPGIEISEDPLLQGRILSYTDAQVERLRGPNFLQIPINQPICPFQNNNNNNNGFLIPEATNEQQAPTPKNQGFFEESQENMGGNKRGEQTESFQDHYSQAKQFLNSLMPYEQQHLLEAFTYEIGKCKSQEVKNNAVDFINHIDHYLAKKVADNVGAKIPNKNLEVKSTKLSPALTMADTVFKPDTRSVAIILNGTPNTQQLTEWVQQLVEHKINYSIIDKKVHRINEMLKASETYSTVDSTQYDSAILISPNPTIPSKVLELVEMTYVHHKPLALAVLSPESLLYTRIKMEEQGVYDLTFTEFEQFIEGIAQARFWERIID